MCVTRVVPEWVLQLSFESQGKALWEAIAWDALGEGKRGKNMLFERITPLRAVRQHLSHYEYVCMVW